MDSVDPHPGDLPMTKMKLCRTAQLMGLDAPPLPSALPVRLWVSGQQWPNDLLNYSSFKVSWVVSGNQYAARRALPYLSHALDPVLTKAPCITFALLYP